MQVPDGWFLYACYFGRYTQNQRGIPSISGVSVSFAGAPEDAGKDTYEPSILFQLGYMLNGNMEPFCRYEYLRLAGTPVGSQNNVQDLSVGWNWYIYGHNLKFTQLLTYLPTGIPISDDGADIEISNRKAEIVLISQLQWLL